MRLNIWKETNMKIKELIGEDEELIELDEKSEKIIVDYLNRFLNCHSIQEVQKVAFGEDYHYVVSLSGGENGKGNWYDYLFHLSKIFVKENYIKTSIQNIWLIRLENDCSDDVHDVYIGISL